MIAQKLRYYRLMQRITQRDLAAAAGMSPGVLGKIEARNTDVTMSTAVKLARALEVRVDKLIGDLTESQQAEMRIANRLISEMRAEKRLANNREQKRRYNQRQANSKKL